MHRPYKSITRHSSRFAERSPITHGIPKETTEQGVIISSVAPHLDDIRRRKGGSVGTHIPTSFINGDNVYDIKKGDPLFSYSKNMSTTFPLAFSSLNGISIDRYKTSYELEQALTFLGIAQEPFSFKHGSTTRLKLSNAVCITGTIVNTGTQHLFPGDKVRYTVPYYNIHDNPSNGVVTKFPDKEWVESVSGSSKTARVSPHLMKVDTESLVRREESSFYKLIANSDIAARDRTSSTKFFPTLKIISAGRGNVKAMAQKMQFDPQSLTALAQYTSIGISAYNVIETLIENNVLQFNMDHAEETGIQRGAPAGKNLQHMAGLIGLYSSHQFKEWKDLDRTKNPRLMTKILQSILFKQYYNFLSPGLKRKIDAERMGGGEARGFRFDKMFFRGLKCGSQASLMHIYGQYLSEMKHIVGTIVKGGAPHETVDVDMRSTYIL